jgi:hypothetical protein
MQPKCRIFTFSALCFLSVLPACPKSDNDVGRIIHDSGATGGAGGTGGSTTAPVGGAGGTGGSTTAPACTRDDGKTFAVGESYKPDRCNTCTCMLHEGRMMEGCWTVPAASSAAAVLSEQAAPRVVALAARTRPGAAIVRLRTAGSSPSETVTEEVVFNAPARCIRLGVTRNFSAPRATRVRTQSRFA